MATLRVGFVGWRGMVGSVLMDRMLAEDDFAGIEAVFFSTSQVGHPAPTIAGDTPPLQDAYDLQALADLDVILTCQGGDYTDAVYRKLLDTGWLGTWIDAASSLRMQDDAVIVLDPVNRPLIRRAKDRGCKAFVGGNCTVSLMLMGLGGLFEQGWVEWISSMTYQAASGAGARNMRELVAQMRALGLAAGELLDDPANAILELDREVQRTLDGEDFPSKNFGAPLAGSLIPWIDRLMPDGDTREEYKGFVESNKILGNATPIPVDGLCVRVGAMRSHAQALTIKLNSDVPLDEIEAVISEYTAWTHLVPNDKASTLSQLTPAAVSGTLNVPVGRLRKLRMGPEYLAAFTVGDQLLWGAAEPLRRMLRMVR